MKKILSILLSIGILYSITVNGQCTGQSTYDLTVSGTTVLHPTSSSFTSAIVCPGGVLIDSANCCTRWVHVLAGGTYTIGGSAYGMAYVKSGGTFDAHNSTLFFGVYYETGATILNYTGPITLCPSLTFTASSCTTGINEPSNNIISVSYNQVNKLLNIEGTINNSTINIFDCNGKRIIEHVLLSSNANQFDVSMLNSGVYLYTIIDDKGYGSNGKFAIVD